MDIIEKKLLKWSNIQFKKNLIYPSVQQFKEYIQKNKLNISLHQIKKFRNSLEGITKFTKLNEQQRRKRGFIPKYISNLGWVQVDLGFMQWRKKNYGKFILAVNELSQMTYVKSIKNKKFNTLKDFFLILKKTPGFEHMKRVISDEESALSRNNRTVLEDLLPTVKFYVTKRKAWMAERYIRTFKSYISKILLIKKLPYTKWRDVIELVLTKMNTKTINKINMRPIDINKKTLSTFLNKVLIYNPQHRVNFYGGIPLNPQSPNYEKISSIFKFEIGDIVYLTKKIYPTKENSQAQTKYWGETRSIAGHFDKTLPNFKIINRYLISSTKLYIIPLYDIKSLESGFIYKKIYENYIRIYPKKE